jgi:hypothetical protein
MSSAETVHEKAQRYLSTGRLTVLLRVDSKVLATVAGDTGKHTVTIDELERWRVLVPGDGSALLARRGCVARGRHRGPDASRAAHSGGEGVTRRPVCTVCEAPAVLVGPRFALCRRCIPLLASFLPRRHPRSVGGR